MARGRKQGKRDIERGYPLEQVVAKLRRLADSLEQGRSHRIQVAGQRITIPAAASFSIEHERGAREEELEFQLTWTVSR